MITEKMLECLMLDRILYTHDGDLTDIHKDLEEESPECLENMISRYFNLQDEFINEYELPKPLLPTP